MKNALLFTIIFAFAYTVQAQVTFNTVELYTKNSLEIINRAATIESDSSGEKYLRLSELQTEGMAWYPTTPFSEGTIELEMRGKDVFQRSFIGIVFNGQNDSTYEAVYCRPFNFFAKDSVRRVHAIQYISHPEYTWSKLRTERNAEFESEIVNPPNPNSWFTLKLVITEKSVSAFINGATNPALKVTRLSAYSSGKIGIFAASFSGGDFRNMKVAISK